MKEANFSINSENSSSFEETGSTMTAITPAKFENSFWVKKYFLCCIYEKTALNSKYYL